EELQAQWEVLGRIFGLFAVITFFWSVFDQTSSAWTFFARDCLNLNVLGYQFAPDQHQWINPTLIIVLLPAVTILWRILPQWGVHLRPTDKMLIGFILTASTTGLMSVAGLVATPESKGSPLWLVAAYFLITMAEICISVVGLELAFTAAPKNM